MKNKIWLIQIPVVLLFSAALLLELAPSVNGYFTNTKFRTRGPVTPKNRIVIVDVDNDSLAHIGRWPWRRDVMAGLIQRTFDAGAKVVGLDVVFSEENRQISDELMVFLKQHRLEGHAQQFETDLFLREVIQMHSDRLVLGWIPDQNCQPAYSTPEFCPVASKETLARFGDAEFKFTFTEHTHPHAFDPSKTPLMSVLNPIFNIPIFNQAAKHSGFFSVEGDRDGVIRRTHLVNIAGGRAFPSLALEMARVGLGENLQITTNEANAVSSIRFAKSGQTIPVSRLGLMDINFRGPAYTFPYVSALDILGEEDQVQIFQGGVATKGSKSALLKDAYVLVGITAVGVYDIRSFPFDEKTPGVEGHATILDNLLSNDMMSKGPSWALSVLLATILVGGAVFAFGLSRLDAVPSLLLIFITAGLFTLVDLKVLFANGINLNTGYLYLELFALFVFSVAMKYVVEERKKKFIRGAFSKYVAPTIVDSILKDPTKLSVGGDRRELTILFSDIRGFTTFSEGLDAKQLTQFLNDYLGIMTDIVFECEGTLDKYIGDAVMAFWGAPLDQPNHAVNSARAAVLMQKALRENRERFKKEYGVDVQIGIGLNTGIVSVGNMGSERIFEYTVIGDHVNLASRLESITKYYGAAIVTSRFTFDSITAKGEPLPPHRVLDFVKVKGKQNAVELIEILVDPLPEAGLQAFAEGRKLYTERRWDDAARAFERASKLLKSNQNAADDGPSNLFIERCKLLKESPPKADWNGSWEMDSK